MNKESIQQYAARQRQRYQYEKASKEEKSRILDDVIGVTQYHRKAAIRLLAGKRKGRQKGRRVGRPTEYGLDVILAARVVHEAAAGIGARRLHPFVPELMARLRELGELLITDETAQKLMKASPTTLERMLASEQVPVRRRARSLTKPGTLLRNRIPVKTFREWDDAAPGFLEVDTVAHCGDSVEGFHLWTVTAVDIATGWVEMEVVGAKTQVRVGAAIKRLQRRLPVALMGLDSDNGSEFINRGLYEYCQDNKITFTRSRPYKKNDSAHVEQKNGAVIRRLTGHGRYASPAALAQLQKVYSLARLHVNFFQPVRKLSAKRHEGSRIIRYHDVAKTPYQRMVDTGMVVGAQRAVLDRLYASLNPLQLSRQIDEEIERLVPLACRQGDPIVWGTRKRSHNGNPNFEVSSSLR